MTEPSTTTPCGPRPARRLLRISLSMLLVLIALVAVWLARVTNRARLQQEVVRELRAKKYWVYFDYEYPRGVPLSKVGRRIENARPPAPVWLLRLVGEEYFRKIVRVDSGMRGALSRDQSEGSRGPRPDDELVRKLCDLGDIRSLSLEGVLVGDAGLAHMHRLRRLEGLDLQQCPYVTDKSLAQLEGLERLEVVGCAGCPITARGVAHLKTLPSLRLLHLDSPELKANALIHLKEMRGLRELTLVLRSPDVGSFEPLGTLSQIRILVIAGDGVTDAALVHVGRLDTLEMLRVHCRITDEGVAALFPLRNLLDLTIIPIETQLTDRSLESLQRLGSLKFLELGSYRREAQLFSNQGVLDLIKALPHLRRLAFDRVYLNPETTQKLTETRPGLTIDQFQ